MESSPDTILGALGSGLPLLLSQMGATLVLLVCGVGLYVLITPVRELAQAKEGNAAAGLSLAGACIAMAIPLAATLATSHVLTDILLWGAVAVLLQLLAFAAATLLMRDLSRRITDGNIAAATVLVGIQVAVALINAAAMAG